jgi:hypothetical protein
MEAAIQSGNLVNITKLHGVIRRKTERSRFLNLESHEVSHEYVVQRLILSFPNWHYTIFLPFQDSNLEP